MLDTRFLTVNDIDQLMELENKQWSADQLPTQEKLMERIKRYPHFCAGTFCSETGSALASLFTQPMCASRVYQKTTWYNCTDNDIATDINTDSVFGVSLTSINANAANAVFVFLYPKLLKKGFKYGYLGSPIPGYKKAINKKIVSTVEEYVNKKHPNKKLEPYDPQLNYYYRKGFRQIVSIQENYFPHEKSMDYGVILKTKLPYLHSMLSGK